GQSAGENYSGHGNDSEFISPAQAKNGPEDSQRDGIGHEMPQGDMQEGRPENPRQTAEMTRPDAVLVEMTIHNQIVEDKDGPTKPYQRKNRHESFGHRAAFKVFRWHSLAKYQSAGSVRKLQTEQMFRKWH